MTPVPSAAAASSTVAVRWRARMRREAWPLAICGLVAVLYLTLLVRKYLGLGYVDWDMAFTNQAVWKIGRGEFDSTVFGFHVFGAHTELIHVLVSPLLLLVPHPLSYPVLVIVLFALSAWLFHATIRDRVGETTAAILCLAYCVFPANFFALTHEYTVEVLSPALVVACYHYYDRRRFAAFCGAAALLLLVKENMAFVVAMFGLVAPLAGDRDRLRWGLAVIVAAGLVFVVEVRWLIPHFLGATHSLWVRYSQFGASPPEIIQNMLNPLAWLRVLATPENRAYLLALFGLMLLPAILSPRILVLAAPLVLMHAASNNAAEKTIYYHYALAITPIIFLASAATLARFVREPPLRALAAAICLVGVVGGHLFHLDMLKIRVGGFSDPDLAGKWSLIERIPPQAGVIASFEFLMPLSLRSQLYSLHKVYHRDFQDPDFMRLSEFSVREPFVLPASVEYALINSQDPLLRTALLVDRAYVEARLAAFFVQWQPLAVAGNTVLYRRRR